MNQQKEKTRDPLQQGDTDIQGAKSILQLQLQLKLDNWPNYVITVNVAHYNFLRCLFIYVSALTGHLQAEYKIILGKLPHYNGAIDFVL
jgi:hypothetical protein